jgi:hypothetical protein
MQLIFDVASGLKGLGFWRIYAVCIQRRVAGILK